MVAEVVVEVTVMVMVVVAAITLKMVVETNISH